MGDSSGTGVQRCRFLFSSRRRHTRFKCDWSSDVCSSDLPDAGALQALRMLGLALALCLLAMVAVWAVAGWLGQGRSFQAALQLWQQFPVWRLSMLGSAVAGAALLWALVRGGQRMACPRYTLAPGLGP